MLYEKKRISKPIEIFENSEQDSEVHEKFGLSFVENRAKSVSPSTNEFTPLDLRKCSYEIIYKTDEDPSAVIRQHLNFISDDCNSVPSIDSVTQDDTQFDTDFGDDENEINCSLSSLKNILLSAIALHFVYKTLSSCSKTSILSRSLLPFMNTLLGDLFVQHQNDKSKDPRIVETAARHDQRLNDVLKSWNFVKHIVPGDGDCLFRCVAILVKQQVRHNPSHLPHFLLMLVKILLIVS